MGHKMVVAVGWWLLFESGHYMSQFVCYYYIKLRSLTQSNITLVWRILDMLLTEFFP
jgi:hypothetical protein